MDASWEDTQQSDCLLNNHISPPTAWNSLSVNTCSADSFISSKCRLKSEHFASTYATYDGSALSQHFDSCFTQPIYHAV